jgi:hypothetical protein
LGKGRENIDSLYRQILHFAFKNASDATLELFKAVVGTIAIAKVPLHRNDLKHYLGREDAEDDRQIGVILHKLSSVISMGDDGLLHLRHLSFVEFLTDVKRCHEFFIDQINIAGTSRWHAWADESRAQVQHLWLRDFSPPQRRHEKTNPDPCSSVVLMPFLGGTPVKRIKIRTTVVHF